MSAGLLNLASKRRRHRVHAVAPVGMRSYPRGILNKSISPVFCATNPLFLKAADLEGLTCSDLP